MKCLPVFWLLVHVSVGAYLQLMFFLFVGFVHIPQPYFLCSPARLHASPPTRTITPVKTYKAHPSCLRNLLLSSCETIRTCTRGADLPPGARQRRVRVRARLPAGSAAKGQRGKGQTRSGEAGKPPPPSQGRYVFFVLPAVAWSLCDACVQRTISCVDRFFFCTVIFLTCCTMEGCFAPSV